MAVDLDYAGQRLVGRHIRKETILRHLVVDLDRFIIIIVVVPKGQLLRIDYVVLLEVNLGRR